MPVWCGRILHQEENTRPGSTLPERMLSQALSNQIQRPPETQILPAEDLRQVVPEEPLKWRASRKQQRTTSTPVPPATRTTAPQKQEWSALESEGACPC